MVEADGKRFVGPDNGLFELVLRRARQARCFRVTWRPAALSATFHGRDLFAPVAATLRAGRARRPGSRSPPTRHPRLAGRPAVVVYIDRFGNAMTGLRAASLAARDRARGRRPAPSPGPHLRRRAGGRATLVRERQRPRRDRRQRRPARRHSSGSRPAARSGCIRRAERSPARELPGLRTRLIFPARVGASPSGKAPDFGSGIRRFESCRPSHSKLFMSFQSVRSKRTLDVKYDGRVRIRVMA